MYIHIRHPKANTRSYISLSIYIHIYILCTFLHDIARYQHKGYSEHTDKSLVPSTSLALCPRAYVYIHIHVYIYIYDMYICVYISIHINIYIYTYSEYPYVTQQDSDEATAYRQMS